MTAPCQISSPVNCTATVVRASRSYGFRTSAVRLLWVSACVNALHTGPMPVARPAGTPRCRAQRAGADPQFSGHADSRNRRRTRSWCKPRGTDDRTVTAVDTPETQHSESQYRRRAGTRRLRRAARRRQEGIHSVQSGLHLLQEELNTAGRAAELSPAASSTACLEVRVRENHHSRRLLRHAENPFLLPKAGWVSGRDLD